MPTYRVPCRWQCWGVMYIEAPTRQNAIEQAFDAALPDGDYEDGSFVVYEDEITLERNSLCVEQGGP